MRSALSETLSRNETPRGVGRTPSARLRAWLPFGWGLCGLTLVAALPAQDPTGAGLRALTTPDGDRFLLLPTGGPAIVHWVIVTPAGSNEDPEGLDGLAVAVARASMAGTTRVGTRNRATEEDLLARVEENERKKALLQGSGQELPEALLRTLSQDRSQAEAVADRLAWERALRAVPAMPSRLSRTTNATVLELSAAAESVGRIAALLLARREEPILRGIHDELRGVRAEFLESADAWTSVRDEVRSLAYGAHPAGRASIADVEGFRPLSRAQALDVFVRTQRPDRTVHVITGGFDVEVLVATLVQAFAASVLTKEPFVPPPPLPAPRARTSRLTNGEMAGIAVACRVLPQADPDAVALAMTWLADGDESFLARWLFSQGVRAGLLRGTYPFGGVGSNTLALIEVGVEEGHAEDPERVQRLFAEVDAALAAALAQTPIAQELQAARAMLAADRAAMRVAPDRFATFLALRCASLELSPGRALQPLEKITDGDVIEVLRSMLAPERRVRVTQEKRP